MKTNNIMLHTITRVVSFIILSFSIYSFFVGFDNPGGGFIGGLMTAAGLLLLYISFDIKKIKKAIPFDYSAIIAWGLIIGIGTGIYSMFLGYPFLTQFHDYFSVPILGELKLKTALPFDLGIYLVVVAVALLSILTIAEDDT
ncbi:Na(+)/H(+) antiporter subunit B [Bacillus shivajii]|uniref:Na(+)/H(+) antiporter subunit B n=1 Tax=Bacillus shivajii TaxID=1983719 RepID=UPI001CF9CC60|nr:Na(+)/H(+) antiporter subunit B [Bacillus shivajii]UCZ54454.1 Na(+)/H(+) antiporter subunit B [Bacillus shivajii]